MGISLDTFRNLAIIAGTIFAGLTLWKALIEYSRQGVQKRAEFFFSLNRRLSENNEFVRILQLLEFDNPEVEAVSFGVKRELLGLFEEVAVLLNSGLINEDVALHFFGYYALDCWDNELFCRDLERDGPEWIVLRKFVGRMRSAKLKVDRSSFRF